MLPAASASDSRSTSVWSSSPHLVHQVASRIDGRAVDAYLVVEVRPGGASRGADRADRLTTMHTLALTYIERGEMPVERVELATMINDDQVAIARVAPGEDHLAAAGHSHGEAVARRD